ncbi:uncharacterized protein [Halyomorpha halys]|uniref:uncharacterized protein n=1 Tax=Halyomorpha halys TaxID=286706 RepID=UPI0006D4FC33|nr:uncharacterized protein LOC106691647 [Halyomorpha halys]XP_014292980.1 uncharacterized protein LOC106691647 [Halyomorpha halys]XP_014292981.1 uncharacterized protein LOC106691647 [Halyomorpha halys]
MNSKGKNDGPSHTDFEYKKDEFNLHYQFFPEDRITTVFLEDPLPCPKKTKKKGAIQRKRRMARRLLRSERTILRKEWKKWQRQLSKQSQKKSGLQPAPKNLRHARTTTLLVKPALTSSQPNPSKSSVLMPSLKRPLGDMSVLELVKYKNDLNNYLKYVCKKSCSLNSTIPKVNGKSEKNEKLRLSKSIRSFISMSNIDKEDGIEKSNDSPNTIENGKVTCYDNGMGEEMDMASELINEGIRILNGKGSKESPSGGPNIKDLSQLIRKLKNFQRAFDRHMFTRSSNPKSFLNKVVSVHAPPSKLHHPPSRKIEPQIKACEFPFNKIFRVDTKEDGVPWAKETIKNSKKMFRKHNLLPSNITETKNSNLTCDSKVWLTIEKLLDERNNYADIFLDKVMGKLRKSADKI